MANQVLSPNVTIALAVSIPSFALLILVLVLFCRRRQWGYQLFGRGSTPINDDEIESWKVNSSREKFSEQRSLASTGNLGLKPDAALGDESWDAAHDVEQQRDSNVRIARVVVYQEKEPRSCPSWLAPEATASLDDLSSPVLARAPNARPGLTDETIQGEGAFIGHIKGLPSRPSTAHCASRCVGFGQSRRERNQDFRRSKQLSLETRSSAAVFSRLPTLVSDKQEGQAKKSASKRPSTEDDVHMGGLSPRPLIHRSEIGRAIG